MTPKSKKSRRRLNRQKREFHRRVKRFSLILFILLVAGVYYEWKMAHIAEVAAITELILGVLEEG